MKRVQFGGNGVDFGLERLGFFAQLAAFFLAGFAFGRVFGLADRFRDLVRLAIELLDLGLQLFPRFFERHEAIDIDLHAAVDAVLFDQSRRFRE